MSEFFVNTSGVQSTVPRIDQTKEVVSSQAAVVSNASNGLGSIGLGDIKPNLDAIHARLSRHAVKVESLSTTLTQIVKHYMTTESNISAGNSNSAPNLDFMTMDFNSKDITVMASNSPVSAESSYENPYVTIVDGKPTVDMDAITDILSKDASEITPEDYMNIAAATAYMDNDQLAQMMQSLFVFDGTDQLVDTWVIDPEKSANIVACLDVMQRCEYNMEASPLVEDSLELSLNRQRNIQTAVMINSLASAEFECMGEPPVITLTNDTLNGYPVLHAQVVADFTESPWSKPGEEMLVTRDIYVTKPTAGPGADDFRLDLNLNDAQLQMDSITNVNVQEYIHDKIVDKIVDWGYDFVDGISKPAGIAFEIINDGFDWGEQYNAAHAQYVSANGAYTDDVLADYGEMICYSYDGENLTATYYPTSQTAEYVQHYNYMYGTDYTVDDLAYHIDEINDPNRKDHIVGASYY